MLRRMLTAGLLGLVVGMLGCGGEVAKKATAQVPVAGTVQLDGKPMDEKGGEISFSTAGEAPVILPIKAGKFEGKGPAGESRVEIRAYKEAPPIMMDGKPFGAPTKENYIPERFNIKSTLTAKVAATGTKDLNFDVESK